MKELKYVNQSRNIADHCFSEYQPNLNQVYAPQNNLPLSVIQEPDITYQTQEHYLVINSAYRNASTWPLHFSFRVDFDKIYKNIRSIEMISAVLPNTTNILNEQYIIFDIDEINFMDFIGSSHKGFAVVPLKGPNQTSGGFINPEMGCSYKAKLTYREPKASLSSLTVRTLDTNGNLYDFGQPDGSTDPSVQFSFTLKLITEEPNRKQLAYRNVY